MRRNSDRDFWDRVDRSAGAIACWPWTGRRKPPKPGQSAGYGVYDHDGRWDYAHRWSWTLTHGTPEHNVLHHCDFPPCCNPGHLYDGTQSQNVRDRDERGRRDVRGERHPRARFEQWQIDLIRDIATDGNMSQSEIARHLDVHVSTINNIVRGHSYPPSGSDANARSAE